MWLQSSLPITGTGTFCSLAWSGPAVIPFIFSFINVYHLNDFSFHENRNSFLETYIICIVSVLIFGKSFWNHQSSARLKVVVWKIHFFCKYKSFLQFEISLFFVCYIVNWNYLSVQLFQFLHLDINLKKQIWDLVKFVANLVSSLSHIFVRRFVKPFREPSCGKADLNKPNNTNKKLSFQEPWKPPKPKKNIGLEYHLARISLASLVACTDEDLGNVLDVAGVPVHDFAFGIGYYWNWNLLHYWWQGTVCRAKEKSYMKKNSL